jgi:glyoxylase-like metal-dependent hydrolase (beta-lactamase superfamily II)
MNMPQNIYDDVFLIGGSGLSQPGDCMIYLVSTNRGLIMIDSGVSPDSVASLLKNIKKLNYNPKNLIALILTHCHIDHVGGATELQRQFDLQIVSHEIEAPVIEGKEYPERIGAYFYGVKYDPCKVNIKLKKDLEEITWGDKKIKFLFTPGHTPGGISPFIDVEGKRILFGQDIHGPLMKGFGSDLNDYLSSMKKLRDLNADYLCEGHFGIYHPKERVKQYINKYIEQYSRKL